MAFRLAISIDPPNAVLVYEKKKLKAIMRGALGEIAMDARKRLRKKAGQGRTYYRPNGGGRYRASAPGQAAVSVSGLLARSVKSSVFKSGLGGRVSEAFYGLFLEDGAEGGAAGVKKRRPGAAPTSARVLLPRPALTAALNDREKSISDRIRASITQDMVFRRMK